MTIEQCTAMKHLLVMRGLLRIRRDDLAFPLDHVRIINAACDLARRMPSNPLVIAGLFVTGLHDLDHDDVHYSCRTLLHRSHPAIGIPLSYALSFDRDSDWREYTTRRDLQELSSHSGPVAALCVTRLAEIICTDPDLDIVILATEVIEDAIRNLIPSLQQVGSTTSICRSSFGSEGILEQLMEQSLNLPRTAIGGDRTTNTSPLSVKQVLRYSTIALNGTDASERCDACRVLLQSGWEVGLYLLAFLYEQTVNPRLAASRSPMSTALPGVSSADADLVGQLLAQSNNGIKLMIDGSKKAKARIFTEGRGNAAALDEELIEQTKQIVQDVPELVEALQYLS